MMIDKLMLKRGYVLVGETFLYAEYEKVSPQGFIHTIYIGYKSHGEALILSYDKRVTQTFDGKFLNEVCGMEASVALLTWLKAKRLAHKYHWKTCKKNSDKKKYGGERA